VKTGFELISVGFIGLTLVLLFLYICHKFHQVFFFM